VSRSINGALNTGMKPIAVIRPAQNGPEGHQRWENFVERSYGFARMLVARDERRPAAHRLGGLSPSKKTHRLPGREALPISN